MAVTTEIASTNYRSDILERIMCGMAKLSEQRVEWKERCVRYLGGCRGRGEGALAFRSQRVARQLPRTVPL